MEQKDRIKPALLIRGNLACKRITGGEFLYSLVCDDDLEITDKCIIIEGDIYAENFVYGGNVVAVTGGVALTEQEGGGDGFIG